MLTVSIPSNNTDGSSPTNLQTVEVLRLREEGGKRPASLSEEEFLNQAVRILSITANQFRDFLHGNTLVIRDPLSLPRKSAIYAGSFCYAVRFINNKNQTAGLSNQALIAPVPIPSAPSGLSAEVFEDLIRLSWKPPTENMDGSRPARIAGYNVYRSETPKGFPFAPINPLLLQKPEFEDHDFQFDRSYYYGISVLGSIENPYAESLPSAAFLVIPRDVFPPDPPQNLNAVVEDNIVILLWAPSSAMDVAGYRIYRKDLQSGEKQLLSKELVTTLSFRDSGGQTGKRYEYSVTAVDTHGNESPSAQTTP